ncbi:helix-hairpin-helix domain-containing protein [Homoserinimonas sp. OAct 916]|uniref:helix-hairpin-helix domain-containing protein n=1 Tax=Homoserinimonas sp. OAct 916 TaxID=2211450 RepID=UPI000DBEA6DB|nr:helix-hairpin-helix domain-containing protein [Homoserinimonas sp. OAct 916]
MSALSGPGQTGPVGDGRRGPVRLRLGVGAAVGLVLIAAVAAILVTVSSSTGTSEWLEPDQRTGATIDASGSPIDVEAKATGANGAEIAAAADVFVHVLGAVEHPGLYQLVDGARVVDVIAAAGGLAVDADPGGVNLARFVGDGEQLYVPAVGEEVSHSEQSGPTTAGSSGGLININRASQAELELLPRVGPALAKRIIDWRESFGSFTSIDDLMSVTGIGEKTFDGLKDLVTT